MAALPQKAGHGFGLEFLLPRCSICGCVSCGHFFENTNRRVLQTWAPREPFTEAPPQRPSPSTCWGVWCPVDAGPGGALVGGLR